MHVFFRRIIINSQIDHVLKLLKMCFHVEIKIDELNILHHFFIVDKFAISMILNQPFFAVVLINYDYQKNNIDAICINFEMTRFVLLKIMNCFDKLNIDRDKIFEKFLILKNFANLFLAEKQVAELINQAVKNDFIVNIEVYAFVVFEMFALVANSHSIKNKHCNTFIFNRFRLTLMMYVLIVNSHAVKNKHNNTFVFNSIQIAHNPEKKIT